MAEFGIGDRNRPRERRLDNPALPDKMVRRSISRREIDAVLADNEVIEVYEPMTVSATCCSGTSTGDCCT